MRLLQELPQVAKAFRRVDEFKPTSYRLLPARFTKLDSGRYLVTNLAGDYAILDRTDLAPYIEGRLSPSDPAYLSLAGANLIATEDDYSALDLQAAKYRTKQAYLKNFTGLHMFVVTLRCDHSCPYCQVSRVSQDRAIYDMSIETASKALDLALKSPSPGIKLEMQGGESLMNFETIQYLVEESKRRQPDRCIDYVIATNLSPVTDEILEYCGQHGILISTSLDGPAFIHNKNRPRPGHDSYERTIAGIKRAREVLGHDQVSALMTTTKLSLEHPREIVDEYIRQGFNSIFLRPLSPYGFAVKSAAKIGYDTHRFLEFYKEGLDYILELNKNGVPIVEEYAALILQKMLTPTGNGYVDLQSPSGTGISAIVYNYNGKVYSADESRMLAEMNDEEFCLGTVDDPYENLFFESGQLETTLSTMAETTPLCADCAFQPWCGTDPVYHHTTQGDKYGLRPRSGFCQRHMGMFNLLIEKLQDEFTEDLFRSWAWR